MWTIDKLLPGDLVLAYHGFIIHGLYCAEVKVPPFTHGKKQLSCTEVATARQISYLRIHRESDRA